ncbi:hypothetical protein [Pseudonocardia sp. ICBG601]|uniref:hypothetical protein n=1 Tax=Pseudonocardia sp. ICBG601 TaxID=2846759 RepID=UPI001CF69B54|nr:hypothetical protein [Pseudonocardia sp. ICBG601]
MPDSGLVERGSRLARGGWAYLQRSREVRRNGGAVPPMRLPERSALVPAHIRRAAEAARVRAEAAAHAAHVGPTAVPAPRPDQQAEADDDRGAAELARNSAA